MNELKVIDEREVLGKEFRIYGDFENPLFLAKDVANWIEHNKPNELIANIDNEEKIKVRINPSDSIAKVLQANTDYWFITEEGLYEVLMLSRKPIAKQFKKKVKEILKSIRKNGMYATDELLENPDLLIKMATKLKEEKEHRKKLESKIEKDRPKIEFYEDVTGSGTTCDMQVVAKLLNFKGVGRNTLYEILRNEVILQRDNIPYQKYVDKGWFRVVETKYTNAKTGDVNMSFKTVVYQKGIEAISKLLKELDYEKNDKGVEVA